MIKFQRLNHKSLVGCAAKGIVCDHRKVKASSEDKGFDEEFEMNFRVAVIKIERKHPGNVKRKEKKRRWWRKSRSTSQMNFEVERLT